MTLLETAIKERVKHGNQQMNIAIYDHYVPGISETFRSHWHVEYEFIYVYSGEMQFELEGIRYTVKEKQGLFINRNVIHSCFPPKGKTARYACIVFGEKFLFSDPADPLYELYIRSLQMYQKAPPAFIAGSTAWEQEILLEAHSLLENYFAKTPAYELNMRIQLLSIFYTLIKSNKLVQIDKKANSKADKIRSVLLYIEQNCEQKLSVRELAAQANLCPEYFCRLFKSVIGQTPKEFIISCRIHYATAMLRADEDAISNIATKCGFDDFNYFSRCFKKKLRVSPTEFKRLITT